MDSTKTPKPTKVSEITSNMNRGANTDEVKILQTYLAGNGYPEVKPDGIFGPVTEDAIKRFQRDNGITADGVVGPETRAKLTQVATGMTKTGVPGSGLIKKPTTQAELDTILNQQNTAVADHPEFAGNSKEALDYAISSGDFSGILNSKGQPYSNADQQTAVADSQSALQPGFDIAKQKDTADTVASLGNDQLDYNNWTSDQANQFQTDKTNLDQTAADNGVLFSGGRAQKEKQLGETYSANQDYKKDSLANSMGTTARNYQANYGDTAANNLSNYYNAGGNTYNASVATGGAKPINGLSALYNPTGLGYQGSKNVANQAAAQTRAAGLLWNKANKSVSTGIKNQYKG